MALPGNASEIFHHHHKIYHAERKQFHLYLERNTDPDWFYCIIYHFKCKKIQYQAGLRTYENCTFYHTKGVYPGFP